MHLSVVMPVYNEAGTVCEIIERVLAVPLDKELIVVNDGSTDSTAEALNAFANREGVRVFHSPINLGKGAAVRIGLTMVRGDIVIIQDADLELNPEEYPQLCSPIERGEADIVFGSRFMGNAHHLSSTSYWGNRFLTSLTNLMFGGKLTDMETCYKVFPAKIIPGLELKSLRFEFEPEMAAKFLSRRYRVVEVPISFRPRSTSEGKKMRWHDGFTAVLTLVKVRFGLL